MWSYPKNIENAFNKPTMIASLTKFKENLWICCFFFHAKFIKNIKCGNIYQFIYHLVVEIIYYNFNKRKRKSERLNLTVNCKYWIVKDVSTRGVIFNFAVFLFAQYMTYNETICRRTTHTYYANL